MSLTPLKTEITAVAELLEAGGDSPESLAKDVVTAVLKALDERTTWVVTFELSPGVYQSHGPYRTRSEAERMITKLPIAQVSTRCAVSRLVGQALVSKALTDADRESESRGDYRLVHEDALAFRRGWKGKEREKRNYV